MKKEHRIQQFAPNAGVQEVITTWFLDSHRTFAYVL